MKHEQPRTRRVLRFSAALIALALAWSMPAQAGAEPISDVTSAQVGVEAQVVQDRTVDQYVSAPDAEAESASEAMPVETVGGPLLTRASVGATRIMMAGDDLTRGSGSSTSSDSMGYRSLVQRALAAAGIDYTLIGSTTSGNATKYDTHYEGRNTWRITSLEDDIVKLLAQKNSALAANPPQVVMLNTGMEDVVDNYKLDTAMARYESLLKTMRSGFPGVKIVVSTLIDSKNATYQKRITQFNQSLRTLVAQQSAAYHDVTLVEFSGLLSTATDYNGSVNPNDKGYAKLAIAWNRALSTVINHPNAKKLAQPPVRIMPLGSSVTYGLGSSSANANAGYRGYLQFFLDEAGVSYDMVGSLRRGNQNLLDTDVEGHSGYRIDQVASNTKKWLTDNPADVVLLHTGGNDVNQDYRLNEAPARLSALIDLIRSSSPAGVKIVVCTLLDSPDAKYEARVLAYNAAVRQVVATQAAAHHDVWLAEMEGIIDMKTDLYDRMHPNAKGYAKMAVAWEHAMAQFMPAVKTLVAQQ